VGPVRGEGGGRHTSGAKPKIPRRRAKKRTSNHAKNKLWLPERKKKGYSCEIVRSAPRQKGSEKLFSGALGGKKLQVREL